jgi:putative DNA methylase
MITGNWPIRTEMTGRLRALGSNALASSILLVCRPRPEDAPVATRREFLETLKRELSISLHQLQEGSIAPVDLAQAAIGPGIAVFSRYSKVLEADGSSISVNTALALINQQLDEYLAEQEGEYDADTRWALAWFEQYGHNEGPFGVAETLSKAKVTAIKGLVEAGILEARGGKVRLYNRHELDNSWDPAKDKRFTAWEAAQHLIRLLDVTGEQSAASLLSRLGSVAETARDLAYRLYTVCDRKGWAQDALGYNMLVIAWPRLKELAARQVPKQEKLI